MNGLLEESQQQTKRQTKKRSVKKEDLVGEKGFDLFLQMISNNNDLALQDDPDKFIDQLINQFHTWWKKMNIQIPFDKFCIRLDKVQPKIETMNSLLSTVSNYYKESSEILYKRKKSDQEEDEQQNLEDHYDFEILDTGNKYQNIDDINNSDSTYNEQIQNDDQEIDQDDI